jgi:phospholipase/lecithinase/hemolysin
MTMSRTLSWSTLRGSLAAMTLALALPAAQAAVPSASFSQLLVFGDSLSDTGNTQAVLGTNALIANLAGYGANGRFSNGPVWHEPMATSLGIPPATRSRSGGSNYAHGGARVDTATGQSEGVITQFNSWLAGPGSQGLSPTTLVAIWAGGNDARDLVTSGNQAGGVANSISALSGVLTGLVNAGAQTLLVPNLPDLGRIPENLGTANAAAATAVTQIWNTALLGMLVDLTTTTGVAIYHLDVFTTFNSLLDDPAQFGFLNTTGQCRSVTNFGFTETSCANPDTWVFWDAIHPTRAAHAVVGSFAVDLLVNGSPLAPIPEPATLIQLALGLALLGAWAQRRRSSSRR